MENIFPNIKISNTSKRFKFGVYFKNPFFELIVHKISGIRIKIEINIGR